MSFVLFYYTYNLNKIRLEIRKKRQYVRFGNVSQNFRKLELEGITC